MGAVFHLGPGPGCQSPVLAFLVCIFSAVPLRPLTAHCRRRGSFERAQVSSFTTSGDERVFSSSASAFVSLVLSRALPLARLLLRLNSGPGCEGKARNVRFSKQWSLDQQAMGLLDQPEAKNVAANCPAGATVGVLYRIGGELNLRADANGSGRHTASLREALMMLTTMKTTTTMMMTGTMP